MLRNLIVLPDGTEIFSGTPGENAIKSLTVTECVNSGTELTLGSVQSAMLEATLLTREGNLRVAAGDMLTLYKVDDAGTRIKAGTFYAEKPTRPSANTYKLTAYDAVSKLDKDLTAWLAGLDGWPYGLCSLAAMVCAECGLELVTEDIPNGDYAVRQFAAQVTGRQLIQWVGEACGRFCRATVDGKIEFAWYASSGAAISPTGDFFYYGGSLTYEDYQVAPVEKVQIRLTDSDVGVIWPNEEGEKNTYIITGNYLLTADTSDALLGVAQKLYEILKEVQYTPCKVAVPAYMGIRAGDIVTVSDRNGITFNAYIMTRTGKGQRDTLECTGSPRRDSSTAVNNDPVKKLYGKTLEIQKSIEGLKTTAQGLQGQYSELQQTAGQVSVKVGTDNGTLTTVIDPTSWQASLVDADGSEKSGLRFDFETGRFVFNGTGQFGGANEGDSYIAIDGRKLALYDSSGKAALEVGYQTTALSDAARFAFVKFLSRTTTAPYEGMVMRFYDGLWVGNANVSMDDAGGFVATQDSAGIFIQTFTGNVRVYNGTGGWKDVYTGDAVARFG